MGLYPGGRGGLKTKGALKWDFMVFLDVFKESVQNSRALKNFPNKKSKLISSSTCTCTNPDSITNMEFPQPKPILCIFP